MTHQWMYHGQLRIVGEVMYVTPTQPTLRYRVYGYIGERRLPVVMLEKVGEVETTYRLFGDHLGSLRAVVRVSDGKAVQWMRHGPWGELGTDDDVVVAGFARVPFGFAAGIYDEATGLVRFGKYGEDKDHMCRDVPTEITASCLPMCAPLYVCRRT